MPRTADSGYSSYRGKIPQRGSNMSHNHSQSSGKYNPNMSSSFHSGQPWPDLAESSQLNSASDQNFPTSPVYPLNTAIDPSLLMGINPTANNNDHIVIDQFTQDFPQTFSLPGYPQNDQLSLSPQQADVQSGPWNLLITEDNIMEQMDPPPFQHEEKHKRRRLNARTESGYGSHYHHSSSAVGSSPARSMNPPSSGFAPSSMYPMPPGSDGGGYGSQHAGRLSTSSVPQHLQDTTSLQDYHSTVDMDEQRPRLSRKYEKKHTCNLCPPDRNKSFQTVNDLARHRRTVHKNLKKGDRVWKCEVDKCEKGDKIWPRLDNFKSHVKRMHAEHYDRAEQMHVSYDPEQHGSADMETQHDTQSAFSEDVSGLSMNVMPSTSSFRPPSRSQAAAAQTPRRGTHTAQHLKPPNQRRTQARSATRPVGSRGRVSRSASVTHHMSSVPNGLESQWDTRNQFPSPNFISFQRDQDFSFQAGQGGLRVAEDRHTIADPASFARDEFDDHDFTNPSPSMDIFHSTNDFVNIGHGVAGNDQLTFEGDASPMGFPNATGEVSDLHPTTTLSQLPDKQDIILLELLQRSQEDRKRIANLLLRDTDVKPRNVTSYTRSTMPKVSSKDRRSNSLKELRCDRMVKAGQRCTKTFASGSELRKHMKRHDRRYGCTFDGCYKRFGTKWEWSRHEHNQHTQVEVWRCQIKEEGEKTCAQTFNESADFMEHLRKTHSHREEIQNDLNMATFAESCKLARKFQGPYWCGYCNAIITQSSEVYGVDMIKQRDIHVAGHIDNGDIVDSDEWIELRGGGKTKEQRKNADDSDGDITEPSGLSPTDQHNTHNQQDQFAGPSSRTETKPRLTTTMPPQYPTSRGSVGPSASPRTPSVQVTNDAGQTLFYDPSAVWPNHWGGENMM